jgi:hypothetical protein
LFEDYHVEGLNLYMVGRFRMVELVMFNYYVNGLNLYKVGGLAVVELVLFINLGTTYSVSCFNFVSLITGHYQNSKFFIGWIKS